MILIVCVDDRMGMAFNHRRLSQDRVLREHMLKNVRKANLWMSPYSGRQFKENTGNLQIADDFTSSAAEKDYCFVELADDLPDWDRVESILLYRWNRAYPSDQKLEIPAGFYVTKTEEFPGHSHELITMEVYER